MSLASELQTDHQYIEGTETVTLTPKNRTASADASVTAKRGPLRFREIQVLQGSGGGITGREVAFNLFSSTMGSLTPQPLDQITDSAGKNYSIISVDYLTLGQRWRCVCNRL